MELSLVPIEGEKDVSEEKKARAERRARPIPPEKLSRFDDEDRKQIKHFLILLITLSERVHHEMAEAAKDQGQAHSHKRRIAELQSGRRALFDTPPPAVVDFIELLQFFVMEPWPEFEMMIAGIRGEDLQRYYEAKLKAVVDPHHMDAEGDVDRAQDEQMENARKCRITPHEIEELVQLHSLESMVKNLIHGRGLMNGEFWNVSHYNL
jgi:hypothetical protein